MTAEALTLSRKEAAAFLGIGIPRLDELTAEGTIPHIPLGQARRAGAAATGVVFRIISRS